MYRKSKKKKKNVLAFFVSRQKSKKNIHKSKRVRLVEKRKKIKQLFVLLFVALVVLIFIGFTWLTYLDIFSIKNIAITGVEKIERKSLEITALQSIKNTAGYIFSGRNIALYSKKTIEKRIVTKYPRIKDIKITTKLPNNIDIAVKEYQEYALWCKRQDNCFYLNKDGYIFDTTLSGSQNFIKIYGGLGAQESVLRKKVVPKYFAQIVTLLKLLKTDTGLLIEKVVIIDKDAFFYTNAGWYIKIALTINPKISIINLQTLLSKEEVKTNLPIMNYIDIRFGNRAYYKLYEVEQ